MDNKYTMNKKNNKTCDFIDLVTSQPSWAFLHNFLLVMTIFSLSRIIFFIVNQRYFPDVELPRLLYLMKGGIQFDLTALLYVNLL